MVDKNRWGVIYSTNTGIFKKKKYWERIRVYLDTMGVDYDFVQSDEAGSVERLAGMFCETGYETIVLVGDDGALCDAINGIMQHRDSLSPDFALGLIPLGVGHDFARFWDLSSDDYRESVDRIIERRVRKIDVGRLRYENEGKEVVKYFLNCVNIGLGARLVKITNDFLRITGSSLLSVIPIVLRQIFLRNTHQFKIKIETEYIEGMFMSVCMGNALGYGQTPSAVPYNGMIDVTTVTRPKWWQMVEGLWLLGRGHFLNHKNVHPYRAEKVEFIDFGKAPISLDGCELQTKPLLPFIVDVEKEAIGFVM